MNPLWMVKTRFQIIADETVGQRAFKGYREVVQTIWKEEGLQGFYKGLSASYIGCFEGAIQWITYEKIKSALLMKKRISSNDAEKHLSPAEYFLSAAAAKFVAIAATYPHEVVRTRLREQATNGAFKYSGFLNTLSVISREEGLRYFREHQFSILLLIILILGVCTAGWVSTLQNLSQMLR